MKLNHISIICSGEKCLELYKTIGFREVQRIIRRCDTVVYLQTSEGETLEIYIDKKHPVRLTYPEAMGLRHLCFETGELLKLKEELADYSPTEIKNGPLGRSFFVFDYDKQPIEFLEMQR